MTHVTKQLQAYLDGELPPPVAHQVREHLQACADCCRELAAIEQTWSAVDRARRSELTSDLWPAVAARLPGRQRGAHAIWWRTGLATAAAAAGLLLGLQLDRVLTGSVTQSTRPIASTTSTTDIYLNDVTPLDEVWWAAGTAGQEVGS